MDKLLRIAPKGRGTREIMALRMLPQLKKLAGFYGQVVQDQGV